MYREIRLSVKSRLLIMHCLAGRDATRAGEREKGTLMDLLSGSRRAGQKKFDFGQLGTFEMRPGADARNTQGVCHRRTKNAACTDGPAARWADDFAASA